MTNNSRSTRSTESYLTPPISLGSHSTLSFELGYNTDVSALNSLLTSHARGDRISLPESNVFTPLTSHTARPRSQPRFTTRPDQFTSPLPAAVAGGQGTNSHPTRCFTTRGARPADAIMSTNQLVGSGFGRLKNLQRLRRQWIAADYHAPLGIFWDERDMSMFLETLQGRFRDARRSNESKISAIGGDPLVGRLGEPRHGAGTTPIDKPPDNYYSEYRSRHYIGTGNRVGLDDGWEDFVFEIQPPGQTHTLVAGSGEASLPEAQEGTIQSHEEKSTNQSHEFVAAYGGQGDGMCLGESYGLRRDYLQTGKLRPSGTASPNIESKKNRFDPRAPHFDAVIVDLPNVRPADIPNGTHVAGSAWRSRSDLNKLPMESLAGRPGWVFLCVGPTEGLADGKKLLGVWGFKKVEVVALLRNNNGWRSQNAGDWDELNCKVGGWDGQSVFGRTVEWVLVGIKGAVKRSALLATLMENFSLGRRRLYMFGGPDELRPGWVTIGRRIRKTNFHCRDFIKKWGNTPGSKNSWLMPQDDEIEYSRPKTPPAKVRANLRDAGAPGGSRSTNQSDIKMAALGDQKPTATFPHPGQRRIPKSVKVDIQFVWDLQEIRLTPARPRSREGDLVSCSSVLRLPHRRHGGGPKNPVAPPFTSLISEKQVDYHAQTPDRQYHRLERPRGIGKRANIHGTSTPPGNQRIPNHCLAHADRQSIAAPRPMRPMRHLSLAEPVPWGSVEHMEIHSREAQYPQGIAEDEMVTVVSENQFGGNDSYLKHMHGAATITGSSRSMHQMLAEGEPTMTTYSSKYTLGALSRPPPSPPHHGSELGRSSTYQYRYSGTGIPEAQALTAHYPQGEKDIEHPDASFSIGSSDHLVHVWARDWAVTDMSGPGIDLIPSVSSDSKIHNYWHLPPTPRVSVDGDTPISIYSVHKNPQSTSDTPLQCNIGRAGRAGPATGPDKHMGHYQKRDRTVPGNNPRVYNSGSSDYAASQPPYEWKNHGDSPSHSRPWQQGINNGYGAGTRVATALCRTTDGQIGGSTLDLTPSVTHTLLKQHKDTITNTVFPRIRSE